MWLRDDSVYEGVERLYLELDYSPQDPQVQIVPTRKRATIYIHDTQDGMYPQMCVHIYVTCKALG